MGDLLTTIRKYIDLLDTVRDKDSEHAR